MLGEQLILLKWRRFKRLNDKGSGETVLRRSQTRLRSDGQSNFLRPRGDQTDFSVTQNHWDG